MGGGGVTESIITALITGGLTLLGLSLIHISSGGVTLSEGQTMRCIQVKDGCVGMEGTKDYE